MGEVAHLMSKADQAHRRLVKALERVVEDYWSVADALHEAHESSAWMRDDGEHEPRYRSIMTEHGFTSVFLAYCWDEFDLKMGYAPIVDIAGRLRATIAMAIVQPDWSRFSLRSVRPVGSAIVATYEPDAIAAALITAQDLASREVKPGRSDEERDRAPVLARHVRIALKEHGLVPPRAVGLAELESAERRKARIEQATTRVAKDISFLLQERQRRAVVDLVKSAFRRLQDQPKLLIELRAALDEVTTS